LVWRYGIARPCSIAAIFRLTKNICSARQRCACLLALDYRLTHDATPIDDMRAPLAEIMPLLGVGR